MWGLFNVGALYAKKINRSTPYNYKVVYLYVQTAYKYAHNNLLFRQNSHIKTLTFWPSIYKSLLTYLTSSPWHIGTVLHSVYEFCILYT